MELVKPIGSLIASLFLPLEVCKSYEILSYLTLPLFVDVELSRSAPTQTLFSFLLFYYDQLNKECQDNQHESLSAFLLSC